MNDKEMLEEMAEIALKNTMSYTCAKQIAMNFYEQCYRKIPEGSVVLTSEQYSNYLILQTNEEWLKNKATELQADNERLYKNLGKFKESVRKETAKEILQEVKSLLFPEEASLLAWLVAIADKYGVKVEE